MHACPLATGHPGPTATAPSVVRAQTHAGGTARAAILRPACLLFIRIRSRRRPRLPAWPWSFCSTCSPTLWRTLGSNGAWGSRADNPSSAVASGVLLLAVIGKGVSWRWRWAGRYSCRRPVLTGQRWLSRAVAWGPLSLPAVTIPRELPLISVGC